VLCNFDGVVKTVSDQNTAIVNNEPIIVVSGNQGYTIQSSIGELALTSVGVGDTVSMYSYENGMTYSGTITEISDIPSTSSYYSTKVQTYYPMTIAISDADGADLTQGMYLEVKVDKTDEESSGNSFYMSMAYVKKENGNYYVMKQEDGVLKKTYIKTGAIVWGDTIEIKGGITYDDYIAFPYSSDAKEGVKTIEKSVSDLY
jgi:hypothetical protein